jgi:hypothetical protein
MQVAAVGRNKPVRMCKSSEGPVPGSRFRKTWGRSSGRLSSAGSRKKTGKTGLAAKGQRRIEATNLQAIERNPLDADDVAMFDMFEREGWSDEQGRAYILAGVPATAA